MLLRVMLLLCCVLISWPLTVVVPRLIDLYSHHLLLRERFFGSVLIARRALRELLKKNSPQCAWRPPSAVIVRRKVTVLRAQCEAESDGLLARSGAPRQACVVKAI